jgi:hypothetical protein
MGEPTEPPFDPILDEIHDPPMYYNFDHNPTSLRKWAEERRQYPERVLIDVTVLGDEAYVSTIFLGLDHGFGLNPTGPILYETAVFDKDRVIEMDRYATREAAQAGHDQIVTRFQRAGSELLDQIEKAQAEAENGET